MFQVFYRKINPLVPAIAAIMIIGCLPAAEKQPGSQTHWVFSTSADESSPSSILESLLFFNKFSNALRFSVSKYPAWSLLCRLHSAA